MRAHARRALPRLPGECCFLNAANPDIPSVGTLTLLLSTPLIPASALPLQPVVRLALVVVVSALGGGVNAIAGGGTLLTFPALIGLGIPPIIANATSTVALWPGSVGGVWGYREELAGARRWAAGFAVPSLAGGGIGAILLLRTPPARFDALVPWLVLGATALFIAQGPLLKAGRRRSGAAPRSALDSDAHRTARAPVTGVLVAQFLIALYGGYFGAGIGILMLAALGLMGLANIHRMNGLKNWGGLCINAVAAAIFAFTGLVSWRIALAMAAGSIAGGYGTARIAQRVPQGWVRASVIVVGLASGAWLFIAQRHGLL